MTKIYFIRHCETVANRDGIIQGTMEFDPSPEGEKQLESLGQRFKDVHIDRIYTSPLSRAYKTALAVKGDREIEIIEERDFIEFDFGLCQGLSFQQMKERYPESYDDFVNKFYQAQAPGGENYDRLYERVWQATQRIIAQNPDKTIAVTSHGGAIRALFLRLLYNDKTRLYEVPKTTNTAVYEVDFYQDGTFCINVLNDDSHLDKKAAVRLEI